MVFPGENTGPWTVSVVCVRSLNFLPMKLSALPKAFGLKELKKDGFPTSSTLKKTNNTSVRTQTLWEAAKEKSVCPGFGPNRTTLRF